VVDKYAISSKVKDTCGGFSGVSASPTQATP
jgi:hypothetical protein